MGGDLWLYLMLLLTHLAVLSTLWSDMKEAALSSSALTPTITSAHLSSFCTLGRLILFCLLGLHAGESKKKAWLMVPFGAALACGLHLHLVQNV